MPSERAEADRAPAGPGGATMEVPSHCRFGLVLDPRASGLEEMSYGTGIELRSPLAWNGRLLVQGDGGMDGMPMPAHG